ncbi:MAG: LysM peptidoglycan-binding domain-containing protein, partial [Chloroflexi bacterium]|nr:LysM peptidoglycan-binding domain-containing protein [Chloroflexota bacterium]
MKGRGAWLLCGVIAWLLVGSLASAHQQDLRAHVVQPGDTLASIGLRYGVSPWALREANGALSPWHVWAGQRLVLPAPTTAGPLAYRVVQARAGDTVSAVARRHGVDAWDLARANGCWQPWLAPGQWLLIPGAINRPPLPTATATATATATPAATPTSRLRPTRTPAASPTPTWQYTPDGPISYESNAGLTRILGVIHDDAGNTVDGVLVQCCTNQCWTSKPSGSCGPGCYDFALGDWSRNCKWLV